MAKKVVNFANLGELEVECESFTTIDGEQKVVKTINRAEVVCIVAYMLGIPDIRLGEYYSQRYGELLEELCMNKDATIIRYLSKIRTGILNHFLNVDNEIRYNLRNLDGIEYFDKSEIETLLEWEVPVIQPNFRADKYVWHITRLMDEHIDSCKDFFPESVHFEYIRALFVIPKYDKKQVLIDEYNKYKGNKVFYPFQMYMHWNPEDVGNILNSDSKFLKVLYAQHGEEFLDGHKYRDVSDEIKRKINNFIWGSRRIIMVVDCENSNPYKLYGVLKNMQLEAQGIISKIILYDDCHTGIAWDYIEKLIDIPVEHVEVQRVTDAKSLVDMRLAVGVAAAYYREKIDSFILCSSDSDFWGLISSIPEARFLVMYEYRKCGNAIKEALSSRSIFHCAMDDFYMENAGELQRIVLKKVLQYYLPDIVGKDGWELTKQIYSDAYIVATENEMKRFYEKYIRHLRLRIGDDGKFYVAIEE
ncbi:MAG: NYN domain-containing protein [Lachnospiraceae bacterium]|nr:NYN domain-containing protein [Lachnospiraceae bacterium]